MRDSGYQFEVVILDQPYALRIDGASVPASSNMGRTSPSGVPHRAWAAYALSNDSLGRRICSGGYRLVQRLTFNPTGSSRARGRNATTATHSRWESSRREDSHGPERSM